MSLLLARSSSNAAIIDRYVRVCFNCRMGHPLIGDRFDCRLRREGKIESGEFAFHLSFIVIDQAPRCSASGHVLNFYSLSCKGVGAILEETC